MLITVLLVLAFFVASTSGPAPATGQAPAAGGAKVNRDPEAARLVTSDVDNFWKAYDAAQPENRGEVFDREYFGKGSEGLKDFKRLRIDGCGLVQTLATHPRYYASIRESTLKVKSMEGPIRASFRRLKALYDDAVFPDVYFLIGCMSSGGTLTDTGLLIGTEMYGRTPDAPLDELNDFQRRVITSIDRLPHIVAHELIHYQQKYPGGGRTLLAEAVKEGSADFVAELISGSHINTHLHAYADPRERELWEEFNKEMGGQSVSNWLYNGGTAKDRPADLGYFVGYKVCESYYRNAADKKRAVKEILEIKDFDRFLRASGYEEKFSGGHMGSMPAAVGRPDFDTRVPRVSEHLMPRGLKASSVRVRVAGGSTRWMRGTSPPHPDSVIRLPLYNRGEEGRHVTDLQPGGFEIYEEMQRFGQAPDGSNQSHLDTPPWCEHVPRRLWLKL